MDGLCGGDEDENWLGTGGVQGPLPVQGGLAASRAGGKLIVISVGGQVLEVHWRTNRADVSQAGLCLAMQMGCILFPALEI